MHLQSLSTRLVQPRQNDDLIAGRKAIQCLRGKRMYFKPSIRSTLRTLLRSLAALLEFRADHPDGAKLNGIVIPSFPVSPVIHAARVSQLSIVVASTRPACWN